MYSPIADRDETGQRAKAIAVSGTFSAGASMHVSMSNMSGARTLDATYDPAALATPTLAGVAHVFGGYTGHAGGRQPASTTILADGRFTGSNGACSFGGHFTPRVDAPAFDWTIQATGGTSCIFGSGPLHGIAVQSADGHQLNAFAAFAGGQVDLYFWNMTRP